MRRLAAIVALVVLAALPLSVSGTYYVNIASQILLYAIFALGVNVLAGHAGLVTLGHAGLFGIAAYAAAKIMNAGYGHLTVATGALAVTLVVAAVFAVLALRGTGLGFVMITVALGQIVWGVAYRWISLTNGDNGIIIIGRPNPLGLSLATPVMSRSKSVTEPPSGRSSPVMRLKSVVFPAPFGPMMRRRSPGSTLRLTSAVTRRPPNRFSRLRTPSAVIARAPGARGAPRPAPDLPA